MKKFFLLIVIAIATCKRESADLNKFLQEPKNGAKVIVSKCMEETKFKITRIKVTPEEVIKGDNIAMKVQGQALEEVTMKDLKVIAHYNGAEIFSEVKDQGGKVVPVGGKFTFEYTQSVPTFTPVGSWDINLYLRNDKDEDVSCILAHFDIE